MFKDELNRMTKDVHKAYKDLKEYEYKKEFNYLLSLLTIEAKQGKYVYISYTNKFNKELEKLGYKVKDGIFFTYISWE